MSTDLVSQAETHRRGPRLTSSGQDSRAIARGHPMANRTRKSRLLQIDWLLGVQWLGRLELAVHVALAVLVVLVLGACLRELV